MYKATGQEIDRASEAEGKVQREKNQMPILNHDDSDEAQTPGTAARTFLL